MKKRWFAIVLFSCSLFFLVPQVSVKPLFTDVFKLTNNPNQIIAQGATGSALTINLSFGGSEVEQWIAQLKRPYPLFILDMKWADRYPTTVQLLKEKNIPVALLGNAGHEYQQNTGLFLDQLKRFEYHFQQKPLWFRTMDENFPPALLAFLWEAEVNPIASTYKWINGELPPVVEGEIISVPMHRHEQAQLNDLKRLMDSRPFQPLEEMLFEMETKVRKIPK